MYAVGLREGGGIWLPNQTFYTDYDEAKGVADGLSNPLQVFELRKGEPITPPHQAKNDATDNDDGTCEGGYLISGRCSRCGAEVTIDLAIAELPARFGLRGHPGQLFTISKAHSHVNSDGVAMLTTLTESGNDFCTESAEDYLKELAP
jgi:hypothetical protein